MGRVRDYEVMMILSPALDEAQTAGAVERLHRLITDRGGSVTKHEPWGMRRFAYPIRHLREGNYFLTQFKLDGDHSGEVSSALNLSEAVLRHLLVKMES